MELEGIVQSGVIVPNDPTALVEGTRVRIILVPQPEPKSFEERYARFQITEPGLPDDLARQHDHYRLGAPKR